MVLDRANGRAAHQAIVEQGYTTLHAHAHLAAPELAWLQGAAPLAGQAHGGAVVARGDQIGQLLGHTGSWLGTMPSVLYTVRV